MELHFYPGQHLLILKSEGKIVGKYEAWGGPSTMGTDSRMPEEPTWPGLYYIDKSHPYHTPTWNLSKIRWGTPLRDMPHLSDVWYEFPSSKWASVKNDIGLSRLQIQELHFNLYKQRTVPTTWIFNDFGPVAIRWFKDLNGNRKLDGKETLSGQMFHTTPENEAQHALGMPVNLMPSHGCIHLKPADRNTITGLGGFRRGTPFRVHQYNERFTH